MEAPPKRRSMFCNRRSLAPLENKEEEVDSTELYVELLKQEKSSWKKHARNRKKQIVELKNAKPTQIEINLDSFDESNLPQEYRDFLNAAPDYDKLAEEVEQTVQQSDEIIKMAKEVQKEQDIKLQTISKKLQEVSKHIIDNL